MSRVLRLLSIFTALSAAATVAACATADARRPFGTVRAENATHEALRAGYERSKRNAAADTVPFADIFDSAA